MFEGCGVILKGRVEVRLRWMAHIPGFCKKCKVRKPERLHEHPGPDEIGSVESLPDGGVKPQHEQAQRA